MKYKIDGQKIIVNSLSEFNPKHIFECGQVFSYKKLEEDIYVFYPKNKVFLIYKENDFYVIKQIGGKKDIKETIEFFDLNTDYSLIKKDIYKQLNRKDFIFDKSIINKSVEFGYGIRILKQDIFEIIISFICSQNNNIKRITNSLNAIRESLGEKIDLDLKGLDKYKKYFQNKDFYTFPSLKKLREQSEDFFVKVGLGYRARYLKKTLSELSDADLKEMSKLEVLSLRKLLMDFQGVGRKVADCILLFGFYKTNVFPVDTWIRQIYNDISIHKESNPLKISETLESYFKDLSGYIQQYLFYFKREKYLVNVNKD